MRPTVTSMILWLTFSGCLSRPAEPPPQPGDATLGAKAPAGASVLLGGERLEGWVQSHGKIPTNWRFADGILTVGHGDVMTDFELQVSRFTLKPA